MTTAPATDNQPTFAPHSSGPTRGKVAAPGNAWPMVSVIIPVFNAAPYLRESLDSVLSQDYPDIEVVVVDDGSSDDSLAILRSYGARIRLLQQQRRGPGAARNRAVQEARGEYLAFHDADDVWLPGKLPTQMRFMLDHPEHRIVFGQFAFWEADADNRFPDPARFVAQPDSWQVKQNLSGTIYVDELAESCIAMITPIIHREVFTAVGGFDESLLAGSDYDFWLKATYRFSAHKMPNCFAAYRIHSKGVTGTPKTTNFPFVVLKRAIDTFGLTGPDGRTVERSAMYQRMADTWLNFAVVHTQNGSRRIALHALAQYLRYSPRRLGAVRRAGSSLMRLLTNRRGGG